MHVKLHDPQDLTRLQQQSRRQREAKQRDRSRAILLAFGSPTGVAAPATATMICSTAAALPGIN